MIEVTLLGNTQDPLTTLYQCYRVATSRLTPNEISVKINSGSISQDDMERFVKERMAIGHVSPLQQVNFEFGLSGVSRAFSHQFVRHHVGITFEQQSQRYVVWPDGEFPHTTPETIIKAGKQESAEKLISSIRSFYKELIDSGVPAEDARYYLPSAANTNLRFTVNLAEFLHIADERLCTRSQWEMRRVVALMRAEVVRKFSWLRQFIQPKCGQYRLGYCNEARKDWESCPLGKIRPHKELLFEVWESFKENKMDDIGEDILVMAVENGV